METLRRAAIYAGREAAVAKALVDQLSARAASTAVPGGPGVGPGRRRLRDRGLAGDHVARTDARVPRAHPRRARGLGGAEPRPAHGAGRGPPPPRSPLE